jgi:hypothetical protein
MAKALELGAGTWGKARNLLRMILKTVVAQAFEKGPSASSRKGEEMTEEQWNAVMSLC